MKSTSTHTTSRRRGSLVRFCSALLLAGAPSSCAGATARTLRRSTDGSGAAAASSHVVESPSDYLVEGEEYLLEHEEGKGFMVVGEPMFHDPLVTDDAEQQSEGYNHEEWRQRKMEEQKLEERWEALEAVEPKEYVNDETLSFVDPNDNEHARHDRQCGSEEKLWTFKFRTDNYGYETKWKLEAKMGNIWKSLAAGPPGTSKYHDNTVYQGATCLKGGKMYKLTLIDEYADGFCCSYGKGTYSFTVDGITEYDSKGQRTFTDRSEHAFYVGIPVPRAPTGGSNGAFQGKNSKCGANKQEIRVKINTDKYGAENTWEIRSVAVNQKVPGLFKGLNSYGANSKDDVAACVPYGKYRFTMTDQIGDGICCGQQGDGRVEIYIDDELSLYLSDFTFGKKVEHDIIVGYHTRYDQMTTREQQYLECHNWRRKQYHEEWFDSAYVPLKYDFALQDDAKSWANELLGDCNKQGIKHEPGVIQGENLAKNTGSGKWGQLYPVENICRRWFEREETWPYPDNAHFTQGLWASALYVGCSESEKVMPNGGMCRVQVCRYSRAGNCNMGKYDATKGDNWKIPMLMKHNPCGPQCPPEGCH